MQAINIFEEIAIHSRFSVGNEHRETHPVCSPSHFVSSDSHTKHCPFSVPWKIQMQDFKIWKEARNRLLHTPSSHTHKRHLSCLPRVQNGKGDPSPPEEILDGQGVPTDTEQQTRQHFYKNISLQADHVCPIPNGHSSCISLEDKSSALLSSCQQGLESCKTNSVQIPL